MTSDEDDEVDLVALLEPTDTLLKPPFCYGFINRQDSAPVFSIKNSVIAVVDSCCLGMSVISKQLVDLLSLPCRVYDALSRTATGAKVKCSQIAMFTISFYVHGTWTSINCEAMVWETTAKPLLISNPVALSSGLIDFTQANEIRVENFGINCF